MNRIVLGNSGDGDGMEGNNGQVVRVEDDEDQSLTVCESKV